jgi:tRNA(fMet)-specific endonuclease VapC
MRRYLLDSNAVNAFIGHHEPFRTRVQEARRRGDRIGTCEPVIAELFFGLEFSASRDANIERLNRALSQLQSWPFDRAAARQCALVMADLQRRGQPIQMVDMMLAAIALSLGNTTVVTTDTDLLRIPGLTVENWRDEAAGG